MHGKDDEERHDPGERDQEVREKVFPGGVNDWFIDCKKSVNTYAKQGVY